MGKRVQSVAPTISLILLWFRNSLWISCSLFSYGMQHIFAILCKGKIHRLNNARSKTSNKSSETLRKHPVQFKNRKGNSNWFRIDVDEVFFFDSFFCFRSRYSPNSFWKCNYIFFSLTKSINKFLLGIL